eukprot:6877634-Pyramimonas_sp.AAC.1
MPRADGIAGLERGLERITKVQIENKRAATERATVASLSSREGLCRQRTSLARRTRPPESSLPLPVDSRPPPHNGDSVLTCQVPPPCPPCAGGGPRGGGGLPAAGAVGPQHVPPARVHVRPPRHGVGARAPGAHGAAHPPGPHGGHGRGAR